MNRITPDLVVQAYKATGMRPVSGWGWMANQFQFSRTCGCGLSAVCLAMEQGHPGDHDSPTEYVKERLGLSYGYMGHFAKGFDWALFNPPYDAVRDPWMLDDEHHGLVDGLAAGVAARELL